MRWLILTSSTGTGHNMRADSLRQWIARAHGDADEVRILPTLETTHGLYKFGVGLYNTIQRRAPRLHHLYFNYLELASMHRRGSKILGRDAFTDLVRDWRPDRVVSVHAHTNHGFFDLARAALPARPPRCVTYCGELFGGYGFSRHWVNPAADGFVAATGETRDAALAAGAPEARAILGGFLLRPAFYEPVETLDREADALAGELRLDRRAFTILLGTGLAGANNHLAILRELARSAQKLQVVALCGNNAAVRARIETLASAYPALTIRAIPHTEKIPALLRLASVLVARPGTGATSEAILLGTPIVHNAIGGVMPQEVITVKYCRRHACARLGATPRAVARELIDLAQNPAALAALRANLRSALPPGHPRDIVRWIRDLA